MSDYHRSGVDKFVPNICHLVFLFIMKITWLILFGLFIFVQVDSERTCYGQEYQNTSGELVKTVSVEKDPDVANVSIDHRFHLWFIWGLVVKIFNLFPLVGYLFYHMGGQNSRNLALCSFIWQMVGWVTIVLLIIAGCFVRFDYFGKKCADSYLPDQGDAIITYLISSAVLMAYVLFKNLRKCCRG